MTPEGARRSRQVTIVDIARELDLHPASVSRALNDSNQVSGQTRDRVVAAAQRMGYVRNVHASGLAAGSTMTIGVVVPDLVNPFFAQLAHHLQVAAQRRDFMTMVACSNMSSERESQIVSRLIRNVDATIVATPTRQRPLPRSVPDDRRIAFINRKVDGALCVLIDQQEIARLQIAAVADHGHEVIAFVDGPEVFRSAQARRELRHTEDFGSLRFVDLGAYQPSAEAAAAAYQLIPPEATAAVAFNDMMALGLIAEAHRHGRRVPDDLSVVGSDGLLAGQLSTPRLTTVGAPLAELAEAVVGRLLDGGGDARADVVTLAPVPVPGETVTAPAVHGAGR